MWTIPPSIDLWYRINEEVLREQDIPVEEISIKELKHNLYIPYLESLGTDDWNLSPQQLIDNFEYETKHATKVRNADTSYPLEIYEFKDKRIILDGVHRFTKLFMKWNETIEVRKVTEDIIPLIKKTEEEFKKWKWES